MYYDGKTHNHRHKYKSANQLINRKRSWRGLRPGSVAGLQICSRSRSLVSSSVFSSCTIVFCLVSRILFVLVAVAIMARAVVRIFIVVVVMIGDLWYSLVDKCRNRRRRKYPILALGKGWKGYLGTYKKTAGLKCHVSQTPGL